MTEGCHRADSLDLFALKQEKTMFQESELINLCISLISFIIVSLTIRKHEIHGLTFLYTGLCCIFAASIFTVVEGVVLNELFNTLEHISYALAGIAFAAGSFQMAAAGDKLPWEQDNP